MDFEFDGWLERFPDLDAAERAKEEAELLASPDAGAHATQREANVHRARIVADAVNLVAFAVGLWAIFFPRPYALVVSVAFLLPLLAILVAFRWSGLFQLMTARGDARPHLLGALLLPGPLAAVNALEFDLLSPSQILVPALGAGALLTVLIAAADRNVRRGLGAMLTVLPFMFITSAGAITVANCHADATPPTTHEAMLLEKYVTKGRGSTWHLKLGPWGPRAAANEVKVPRAVYEGVTVGAPVIVQVRPGRLGIQWFAVTP